MAGEQVVFDPTAEATGTQVSIDGTAYQLISHDYPPPERRRQWALSPDTEGSLPADDGTHENRVIDLTVRVAAASDAALLAALEPLQQKIGKFQREGGTLRRVLPDGTPITFDVLDADIRIPSDKRFMSRQAADVVMRFVCKPFGRGAEIDLGDNTTMTGPCLIFTEAGAPGDVLALGRLVVDNDDATNNQRWLVWGIQSRFYDAAASAGLFFEAEGRTALSGSTVATGPSGASGGASNNVVRNTSLGLDYQTILSTQASGGGAHLSHVGTFRVFARVQTPTTNLGETSVMLEWAVGDFGRYTSNTGNQHRLTQADGGTWRLLDLGLVTLPKATAGTQRWEGRLRAKKLSALDTAIDVDWLILVPADEGYGEVSAGPAVRDSSPTVIVARDDFNQAPGALNGKVLPIGGTWASSGTTGDWNVTGGAAIHTSSTVGSRNATAGAATFTDVVVQCDVSDSGPANATGLGVYARGTANGFGAAIFRTGPSAGNLQINAAGSLLTPLIPVPFTGTYTIRAMIAASGHYAVWWYPAGSPIPTAPVHSGWAAVLAPGGVAASGTVGLTIGVAGGSGPRAHDAFMAWIPQRDAALFASQSLELKHNGVQREDAGGTVWGKPLAHPGDYLRVPSAGQEARSVRLIVKSSRNVPGDGPDTGADALSARLFVTPRFLVVPEP